VSDVHPIKPAKHTLGGEAVLRPEREILFIKTSSLGDVIHMLPAITDARRHFERARLTWVVEEAFAPLAALHPGVDRVMPVSWRRWRRWPLGLRNQRQMLGFIRALRATRYDAVIDSQGLIHSAVISRIARGAHHGYDRSSVREKLAASFYDVRHEASRSLHAIARNRLLTGAALGYGAGDPLDYGLPGLPRLDPERGAYAVLVHATSDAEKYWPEDAWRRLGVLLAERGFDVVLPSGGAAERARSVRIAGGILRATAPDLMPIERVARLIGGASLVVGVDTGLLYLAAALGVPLVGIFTASDPSLTGPLGNGPIEIVGAFGRQPPVEEVARAIDRVAGTP
jgi:heptosyltransferase-1